MKSTIYLFDKPRETYEPMITILASRRIADATILLAKIARLKDEATSDELDALIKRYQAVEKSKAFWQSILLEE